MNAETSKLAPGLYMVATPIGNARDITLRALDVLASADVLAAEDTRTLRRLMEMHGLSPGNRPMVAYHDHNGARARPGLLAALDQGKSVAYASEAGTPLIADPGFDLARDAAAAGHLVTAAPGPSAVVTALSLAGLPTDRFMFAGFLPNAKSQRKSALSEFKSVPATLVLYESPKRVAALLKDAAEVLGPDRDAALCRELTKRFEECRRGTLAELAAQIAEAPPKGEIVVLIGRSMSKDVSEVEINDALRLALGEMSVRDAADHVSGLFGIPRRPVYQKAMELAGRK